MRKTVITKVNKRNLLATTVKEMIIYVKN